MNITIPKPSTWGDPYQTPEQVDESVYALLREEATRMGITLVIKPQYVHYYELDETHLLCTCYKWEPRMRPLVKDIVETLAAMKKAGWKPKQLLLSWDDANSITSYESRELLKLSIAVSPHITSGFEIRYHEPESLR